jgi:hypothetical protein
MKGDKDANQRALQSAESHNRSPHFLITSSGQYNNKEEMPSYTRDEDLL